MSLELSNVNQSAYVAAMLEVRFTRVTMRRLINRAILLVDEHITPSDNRRPYITHGLQIVQDICDEQPSGEASTDVITFAEISTRTTSEMMFSSGSERTTLPTNDIPGITAESRFWNDAAIEVTRAALFYAATESGRNE